MIPKKFFDKVAMSAIFNVETFLLGSKSQHQTINSYIICHKKSGLKILPGLFEEGFVVKILLPYIGNHRLHNLLIKVGL